MSYHIASLNQVTLIGRLVDAPKFGKTPKGVDYATLVVATNQGYKDAQGQWQQKATFIPCAYFGQNDFLTKLGKGDLVNVNGFISVSEKGEGENRQVMFSVRIEQMVLLAHPQRAAQKEAQPEHVEAQQAKAAPTRAGKKAAKATVKKGQESNLPFDDEPRDLP